MIDSPAPHTDKATDNSQARANLSAETDVRPAANPAGAQASNDAHVQAGNLPSLSIDGADSGNTRMPSGAMAVAKDLGTGALNQITENPGQVAESGAIGLAVGAVASTVAEGAVVAAAAVGVTLTAPEVLLGAAAVGVGYGAYQLYEHASSWFNDAKVVANQNDYSPDQVAQAHTELQGVGAGGVNLAAGTVGGIAGGYLSGYLGAAGAEAPVPGAAGAETPVPGASPLDATPAIDTTGTTAPAGLTAPGDAPLPPAQTAVTPPGDAPLPPAQTTVTPPNDGQALAASGDQAIAVDSHTASTPAVGSQPVDSPATGTPAADTSTPGAQAVDTPSPAGQSPEPSVKEQLDTLQKIVDMDKQPPPVLDLSTLKSPTSEPDVRSAIQDAIDISQRDNNGPLTFKIDTTVPLKDAAGNPIKGSQADVLYQELQAAYPQNHFTFSKPDLSPGDPGYTEFPAPIVDKNLQISTKENPIVLDGATRLPDGSTLPEGTKLAVGTTYDGTSVKSALPGGKVWATKPDGTMVQVADAGESTPMTPYSNFSDPMQRGQTVPALAKDGSPNRIIIRTDAKAVDPDGNPLLDAYPNSDTNMQTLYKGGTQPELFRTKTKRGRALPFTVKR